MSTTRLPELPEARIESYQTDGTMRTTKLTTYDEFDMHAYGLAVWKAAQEAAARVCQEYEAARWDAFKRGHGTDRASDYCQGQSDGGGDCANAIRALPLPEQGSPQERRE